MTEKRKSFYELLKHPKWQKKRLEILNLLGFECEDCGAEDRTLHIHHTYYEKGLAPWEYPNSSLHVLCEDCHKKAQDLNLLIQRQIGRIDLEDMEKLLGYAFGLETSMYPMVVIDVFSYEIALGIGQCWGLSAQEIIDALEEGKIDGWKLNELLKTKEKGSCK